MADSFSIHHITHYLRQMGVKIAHLDDRRDIEEELYTSSDTHAEAVPDKSTDLAVDEILAEVTHLLEQHKE